MTAKEAVQGLLGWVAEVLVPVFGAPAKALLDLIQNSVVTAAVIIGALYGGAWAYQTHIADQQKAAQLEAQAPYQEQLTRQTQLSNLERELRMLADNPGVVIPPAQ